MYNGQFGKKKIIVIKMWAQPGGPATDTWTKKMYICSRTFYSAEKNKTTRISGNRKTDGTRETQYVK